MPEEAQKENKVSDSESIIEKNLILKELVGILNEILTILPYEVYRIHHRVNTSRNNFVIGIGGVTHVREIGDLFMSMKLGDEADNTRPGASFYIRRGKDDDILDFNHDLERISGIFKKFYISEKSYTINFDAYLGNITITLDTSVLNFS